jgi:DNA-binding NarL/FixJ family response regulator
LSVLLNGDAERVLGFLTDVGGTDGDEQLIAELVGQLGTLVDADWIGYSEHDWMRRRSVAQVGHPPFWRSMGNQFWEHVADLHPIRRAQRQGRVGGLKLSDFFASRRELKRTVLYSDWMRPFGAEHILELSVRSTAGHTRTFHFDRFGGRDFNERDRTLLDVLEPHLAYLLQRASTRRVLEAALAELDRGPPDASRGVILLGQTREIEFVSASARRMLRDYFPADHGSPVPDALVEWLDGGQEPLARARADRRLTVRRVGDKLLLEEWNGESKLTTREREVLSLVARGLTNAEVAELLWLAPSTVRKHLENVYAKLGVTTRTAAVDRVFGPIDAEAT